MKTLTLTEKEFKNLESDLTFESAERQMEIHWSDHLGKFCIWFGGQLHGTFKSFNGFKAAANKLIEKHNLCI